MGVHRLAKSMDRKFTPEEEAEVIKYLKDKQVGLKPMTYIHEVAMHFEEKFEMPVTDTAIGNIVMRLAMMGEL